MTAKLTTTIGWYAGAALALLLFAGTGAGAQQVQQDWYAMNNRISSLQDQIFRLQDQLAAKGANRGVGAGAAAAHINPTTAAGLSLRIDSIEQQLRQMNGSVERLVNSVRQIDERLKRFSADADFRFRDLEGGASGGQRRPPRSGSGSGQPRRLPGTSGNGATSGPVPFNQSARVPSPGLSPNDTGPIILRKAPPSQVLGQLPSNVETADLGQAPTFGGNGGNASAAPPRSAAGVTYEKAYEALLRRRFDAAEAGFKGFLRQYPGHNLAGNAQYWLGETYYARGRFRDAAAAFVSGYKKYKTSRKAPDSLLKLAMTLKRLGQTGEACSALDQLGRQYPRASRAVKNRAKQERRNAGC